MEEEFIKLIEASGVQVNRLSAEDRAVWEKATASVLDDLAGAVSPEVLKAAKAVNEVYGK
ncbi:MAG: hypothetical protein LBT65_03060, partial [Synergistaceae bacterium]|jgi:TRAP-type C4-dicarboxylate transport system substrate-binding protein|nr:hypothetical protein [Synergistaceae bacterium]